MDFLTPNSLYALNSVIENESSQAQIHNMTMESNETPYKLKIQLPRNSKPPEKLKSRVETHFHIHLELQTHEREESVRQWHYLKLPEHLSKRPSTQTECDPKSIIYLQARLVLDSNPTKTVLACFQCVRRERRKLEKKKKVDTKSEMISPSDSMVPNISSDALAKDREKVIVFNCDQMVPFSKGDAILQTRITCYCRHHYEKNGFRIHFTLLDYQRQVMATGLSDLILIVDDHKQSKQKENKQRKKQFEGHSVPLTSFTPLIPVMQNFLPHDFDPQSLPRMTADNFQLQKQMAHYPIPNFQEQINNQNMNNNMNMNMQHQSIQQFYQQSQFQPCETPNKPLIKEQEIVPKEELYQFSNPEADLSVTPEVLRVVPDHGPITGGVEVSILGSNFTDGLVVFFGCNESKTTFYNSTTLICILPPSSLTGSVDVTIKSPNSSPLRDYSPYTSQDNPIYDPMLDGNFSSPSFSHVPDDISSPFSPLSPPLSDVEAFMDMVLNPNPPKFLYQDVTDAQLMEMALKCISSKFFGKNFNDTKQISEMIVNRYQFPDIYDENPLEGTLTNAFLNALKFQNNGPLNLSLESKTKHSMLHLATFLDMEDFCFFLVNNGIDVDMKDHFDFTALHYASWLGREEIVSILLAAGSDPNQLSYFKSSPKMISHPTVARILCDPEYLFENEDEDFENETENETEGEINEQENQAVENEIPTLENSELTSNAPFETPATLNSQNSLSSISSESLTSISNPSLITSSPFPDPTATTPFTLTKVEKVEKERRRKRDRMIFNFWIPLLFVILGLGMVQYLSSIDDGRIHIFLGS